MMNEDSIDMYSHFIPNRRSRDLERRKDARKKVEASHLLVAKCRTMDCAFQAPIENISSGGIFINTRQHLFAGQEIAIKFDFPDARKTIMANGEVVRTSIEGVGIRFRMFFKK
jgi:Tfp pilus assembly protein PilZ